MLCVWNIIYMICLLHWWCFRNMLSLLQLTVIIIISWKCSLICRLLLLRLIAIVIISWKCSWICEWWFIETIDVISDVEIFILSLISKLSINWWNWHFWSLRWEKSHFWLMSWKSILCIKSIVCLRADIEITVRLKNLSFIKVC